MLYISGSSIHGLGVFSGTPIPPEKVFASYYALDIPEDYVPLESKFRDYLFNDKLALGIATMINHSIRPNTKVTIKDNTLFLEALCYIEKDEEITIKYGRFATQPVIRNI